MRGIAVETSPNVVHRTSPKLGIPSVYLFISLAACFGLSDSNGVRSFHVPIHLTCLNPRRLISESAFIVSLVGTLHIFLSRSSSFLIRSNSSDFNFSFCNRALFSYRLFIDRPTICLEGQETLLARLSSIINFPVLA